MRTLPVDMTTELAKSYNMICHFFKMEATSTYYWTDCDQNVYFDGQWWTAASIRFEPYETGIDMEVETVSVTFKNIDKALSDIALSEDLRGKPFAIYRVCLDNNLNVIGCADQSEMPIIIDGYVDSMSFDRRDARFEIVNEMIKWQTLTPRRLHTPTCNWVFKSTDNCLSASTTWCDHSKSRCVTLSNTTNFGGFEYISELAEKDLYWGQRVKSWNK